MSKLKHYENIHIPLWLIKDTCWMMHWKSLGITMIVPTVVVAFIIAFNYFKEGNKEFWIQLAVFFWISGNSFWMVCEFFDHEELKYYAAFPFIAGIISTTYFYIKQFNEKKT